jgi:hypothetical protein
LDGCGVLASRARDLAGVLPVNRTSGRCRQANSVTVDAATNIATVGRRRLPWQILPDYCALEFPGGSYPTVGVSGHLLGGG